MARRACSPRTPPTPRRSAPGSPRAPSPEGCSTGQALITLSVGAARGLRTHVRIHVYFRTWARWRAVCTRRGHDLFEDLVCDLARAAVPGGLPRNRTRAAV